MLNRFCRPVFTPLAPTIVPGNGAGSASGGVASIVGSDVAGAIYVNTGTAPQANVALVVVTFKNPFAAVPCSRLLTAPAASRLRPLSGAWPGVVMARAAPATAGFTVRTGGTAIPASASFVWYYRVHG